MTPAEWEAMQPRMARGFRFPGFGGPPPKPASAAKPGGEERDLHRNNFGMDLPWATGAITIGDQTFEDVGIRFKGNGTIGDASRTIKKSLKIELDRNGGTNRFKNHKTFNLHCGVADPSKCRETLAYEIYRAAGVPAPHTSFAEVHLTVPGKYDRELLGIYTLTEQIDKPFLKGHFGTDKGLLMKPEGLRDFEDRGDSWTRYSKQFAPKREATPAESKRLIAFVKLVHKADDAQFCQEIASYLDIDAYLRFLAATAFVANTDSFFGLGHNYYIYLHPKTNQLHFLPWDLDRAFANFPIFGSNTQQMNMSFVHPYAGKHRLTDRVMAMPGVKEKYQELLKKLAAKAFDKQRLLAQAEAADKVVRPILTRDVKASEARKESKGGFGPPGFGKPPEVKLFIEKRSESLAAQLAGTSKGHIHTGGFGPGAFKIGDMLAGPMLEELDTDKNQKLSKQEWMAGAKRLYDACSKDPQGNATERALAGALDGMFAPPPADKSAGGPGPGGPPGFAPGMFMAGAIVKRVDADKDSKVTWKELEAAASKLFDEFDKKKTGNLQEEAFGEMLTALFPMPNFGPPGGRGGDPGRGGAKPASKP
jgi:hypothetical protein